MNVAGGNKAFNSVLVWVWSFTIWSANFFSYPVALLQSDRSRPESRSCRSHQFKSQIPRFRLPRGPELTPVFRGEGAAARSAPT